MLTTAANSSNQNQPLPSLLMLRHLYALTKEILFEHPMVIDEGVNTILTQLNFFHCFNFQI